MRPGRHTRGPWVLKYGPDGTSIDIRVEEPGRGSFRVATVMNHSLGAAEVVPNAKLIQQSPDMLETIITTRQIMARLAEESDDARARVAAAAFLDSTDRFVKAVA